MSQRHEIKDRVCNEPTAHGPCGVVVQGTAASLLTHVQAEHRRQE